MTVVVVSNVIIVTHRIACACNSCAEQCSDELRVPLRANAWVSQVPQNIHNYWHRQSQFVSVKAVDFDRCLLLVLEITKTCCSTDP